MSAEVRWLARTSGLQYVLGCAVLGAVLLPVLLSLDGRETVVVERALAATAESRAAPKAGSGDSESLRQVGGSENPCRCSLRIEPEDRPTR